MIRTVWASLVLSLAICVHDSPKHESVVENGVGGASWCRGVRGRDAVRSRMKTEMLGEVVSDDPIEFGAVSHEQFFASCFQKRAHGIEDVSIQNKLKAQDLEFPSFAFLIV